jgi:hypothetical protein
VPIVIAEMTTQKSLQPTGGLPPANRRSPLCDQGCGAIS